jgi:hypothetical protein
MARVIVLPREYRDILVLANTVRCRILRRESINSANQQQNLINWVDTHKRVSYQNGQPLGPVNIVAIGFSLTGDSIEIFLRTMLFDSVSAGRQKSQISFKWALPSVNSLSFWV